MWDAIAQWVAAAGTLGTVIVLIYQSYERRKASRESQVIEVVLEPLRARLEGGMASILERRANPVIWRLDSGLATNPDPSFGVALPSFLAPPAAVTNSDGPLFSVAYRAVRVQRPYRDLIDKWEALNKNYRELLEGGLLPLVQRIDGHLRTSCTVPDMMEDRNATRWCSYSQLAEHALNTHWLSRYSYTLEVQSDRPGAPGIVTLWCPGGLNFTHGTTESEVAGLQDAIKSLMADAAVQDTIENLKQQASTLNEQRQGLLERIATIRWSRTD
jgi:hypothetical protein